MISVTLLQSISILKLKDINDNHFSRVKNTKHRKETETTFRFLICRTEQSIAKYVFVFSAATHCRIEATKKYSSSVIAGHKYSKTSKTPSLLYSRFVQIEKV